MIVARLLTPDDFGVFSLVMVYLGLAALLNEFGLGSAIIALREMSEHEVAQFNGFALVLGIVALIVTCLAAIPVSLYFGVPELRWVLVAMSVTLLLSGLRTVPASLLERHMQYKTLSLIEGAQSIAQTLLSVGFALAGKGYWALALGSIGGAVAGTGLLLVTHGHRFAWPRLGAIKPAVTMSWRLLVMRLTWYFSSSSDVLVAGKVLGQAAVGTYTMAWSIAIVPVEKVTGLVVRVAFPLFSSVQGNFAAIRRYVLALTEGIALITLPAACGLVMVAKEFVLLVLGPKWIDVVVPLQLLAVFTTVRSVTPLFALILNVTGGARFAMYNGIFAASLGIGSFYVGSFWGIEGIAMAWVILHPIAVLPNFLWIRKTIKLGFRAYLKSFYPALSSTLVMIAVLFGLDRVLPAEWPLGTRVALQVFVGAVTYVASLVVLHRDRLAAFLKLLKRRDRE